MDETRSRPVYRFRARNLVRKVVATALASLLFAGGMYVGNRFLSPPPLDSTFAKTLRSPTSESDTLTNSLGIPFRRLPSGAWISENFVTAETCETLTGSSPAIPTSAAITDLHNRPLGNISFAEATAICRILTDREQATGLLPKTRHYRLPYPEESALPAHLAADEWIRTDAPPSPPLFTATAVVKVETPLYAPEVETSPGGWPRWHENLLSSPSAALILPKDAAAKINVTGSPEGTLRRLFVTAVAPDPSSAADLASSAATAIKNECNALAKRVQINAFSYLRAEVDSAEIRNAKERADLLELMARYDIADTLDLPSWFLGREDLHDDLGVQTAKNNVERLKKFQKLLEDLKGDELPDLTPNPELSDAASAYLRLLAERKLLEVEEEQEKKAGSSDTDRILVAIRAKISRNQEALLAARKSLGEDISRELKVAENLLIDLELVKRRRANQEEPTPPSPNQPRNEAVLESRIAFVDKQLDQLRDLKGDTLYDYALLISETESPLRALIPEYIKHRELAKDIRKAIAEIEKQEEILKNTPIGPDPPAAPPADTPSNRPQEPMPRRRPKPKRNGTLPKKKRPITSPNSPENEKRNSMTSRPPGTKKREQLKLAESDKDIAEAAVVNEITMLAKALTESRERDRKELEYLVAKRLYLIGWHRLLALRADLAIQKDALDSPPAAAVILAEATATEAVSHDDLNLVTFVRDGRVITAHPGYRNPDLHFRLVLDTVDK